MNATKRKFNALINGIGNKSTTTLASKEVNNVPDNDGDSQTKKRRLSDKSSITRSSLEMPSVVRKPLATMKHKKAVSSATAAAAEPPKYAPWDREAFLKRLKSFSNLTDWTPKPARVNEVEWAKRGWVCQKLERVRCCLCNVEILVKLNRKDVEGKEQPVYIAEKIGGSQSSSLVEDADSSVEEALVDKYVDLIVSSHDEGCLWRKRGCDGKSKLAAYLYNTNSPVQTRSSNYLSIIQELLSETSENDTMSSVREVRICHTSSICVPHQDLIWTSS